MEKELFAMERELYYLKKERANLLLEIPDRSLYKKCLPYIIWFFALCAAQFIQNWASFFFRDPINYFYFMLALFIIIFLDMLRAVKKDYVLKRVREYSERIEILEKEMSQKYF